MNSLMSEKTSPVGVTIFAGAATFGVTLGAMDEPLLAGIRSAATGPWNGNKHFWHWFHGAVTVTNVVTPCFFVALLLTLYVVIGRRKPTLAALRGVEGSQRLALVAGAMALSWYVLTAVAYGLSLVQLPFARSSVPALWLLMVAFVAIFPRRRLGWIVVVLLLPGFIWSAVAFSRAAGEGYWTRLPDLVGENVIAQGLPASIRSIDKPGVTAISCTYYAENGCQLVAPRLESEGVKVTPLGPLLPWMPLCIVGSAHPSYALEVNVIEGHEPVGVVCY